MYQDIKRTLAPLLLAAATLVVCAISARGQTGAVAQVIEVIGRVDLMRDSTAWALSAGDTIKPRQVIHTGADGYAVFKLADNSTFEVYPNSNVTFRDTPGDWTDLLEVWIGRIKVHIQKLGGGQPNHNRVRTPTAVISVRGTVFDVHVEDENGTTYVSVEEGQVAVQHRLQGPKVIPLNPGEAIRVFRNQPLAANKVDKGSVAQAVARSLSDGLSQILMNRQRGLGGTSVPGTGGTGVGDQRAPDPPPPPPPPPPSSGPPPPPAQ